MKKILKDSLWQTTITTLCFIAVILFAAISCQKPETDKEDFFYANEVENNNLYAKVENASAYSNVVEVKLMMWNRSISSHTELARGNWKDGGFTIVLPTIDSNILRSLVSSRVLPAIITDMSLPITISNIDTRVGFAEFWGVDKDGNDVVEFFPQKIDEKGNIATASFQYADSDVSVSGYIEKGTDATDLDEYSGAISTWNWPNRTIYLIEMKTGWNIWSSFQSPSKGTTTDKWVGRKLNNN